MNIHRNIYLFIQLCAFLALFSATSLFGSPESVAVNESSRSIPPMLDEAFKYQIGGFSVKDLATSFAIILLTLIFKNIIVNFIFKKLTQLTSRTKSDIDDIALHAIKKPLATFTLILGLFLAIITLPLEASVENFVAKVYRGSSMLIIVWALIRLSDVFTLAIGRIIENKNSSILGFLPLIKKTLKILFSVIGVLMVIDNLGYQISGVLATLGIGGAAIAFASKDTISNFFGSLCLVLDQPFKVGDWIQIGDKVDGDVESIGLRSTRVRTWPKTLLSIPNSIIANEFINNWSKMPKRRVKQVVGVSYETEPEVMHTLVETIRQILRDDEGVDQEFILVNFTDFGESSLDILVYYFTTTIKWLEHMDIRQRVNVKIMQAIEAAGSSIAFPLRSLYFHWDAAKRFGIDEREGRLPGDFGPDMPR